MENTYQNTIWKSSKSRRISIPCMFLCFTVFVILGFLPIAPPRLVKLLKPAFLVLCVIFSGRGYYRLGFEKWLIILLSYLFVIWISQHYAIRSDDEFLSMVLFALFYLFAGLRAWSRVEIRTIMNAVVIACSIYAAIILYSNKGLFQSGGNQHITFLEQTLNRNSSAFAITPGVVCSLFFILFGRKPLGVRLLYVSAYALCLFVVIGLSCRSAFLSAVAGSFLIVWQVSDKNRDKSSRFIKRALLIIFALLLLSLFSRVLMGTNSERLFDYSDTGRDGIWDAAWELIQAKPVFGGGFGYWESSGQNMGTHNTFLTIMLISGYVGGLLFSLFVLFMILECINARNAIALAFAMEMIFHSISESGLDYYAYFPLIIATIFLRYTEHQGKSVSSVLQ